MQITLSATQIDEIHRLVRDITVAGLDEQTKQLIKALVKAGHPSHAIAANFAAEGASVCAVNAARWYAEDVESCLLFALTEDGK